MTSNLFDVIGDQTLQIRDETGRVLWEGVAVDGAIHAEMEGWVWDLTTTDGRVIYRFRDQESVLVPPGGSFNMSGDLRFSGF